MIPLPEATVLLLLARKQEEEKRKSNVLTNGKVVANPKIRKDL
jgi:hypothetical protein